MHSFHSVPTTVSTFAMPPAVPLQYAVRTMPSLPTPIAVRSAPQYYLQESATTYSLTVVPPSAPLYLHPTYYAVPVNNSEVDRLSHLLQITTDEMNEAKATTARCLADLERATQVHTSLITNFETVSSCKEQIIKEHNATSETLLSRVGELRNAYTTIEKLQQEVINVQTTAVSLSAEHQKTLASVRQELIDTQQQLETLRNTKAKTKEKAALRLSIENLTAEGIAKQNKINEMKHKGYDSSVPKLMEQINGLNHQLESLQHTHSLLKEQHDNAHDKFSTDIAVLSMTSANALLNKTDSNRKLSLAKRKISSQQDDLAELAKKSLESAAEITCLKNDLAAAKAAMTAASAAGIKKMTKLQNQLNEANHVIKEQAERIELVSIGTIDVTVALTDVDSPLPTAKKLKSSHTPETTPISTARAAFFNHPGSPNTPLSQLSQDPNDTRMDETFIL
jgi:hypothetical protein